MLRYCYRLMFRYNKQSEFNIPYSGMSYNKNNLMTKSENMFNRDVEEVFKNTEIYNCDFASFFKKTNLTEKILCFQIQRMIQNFRITKVKILQLTIKKEWHFLR